jgi:DNA-directed RNA polymerase specialized sigma24 family protein
VPDALDLIPASVGRTGEELLAADLIEATGHGLTPADATVLYATAVLGMSVAEVADRTGESVVRLRRRRRNVIDGLVA